MLTGKVKILFSTLGSKDQSECRYEEEFFEIEEGNFRTYFARKEFTETNRRRSTAQQPETKSGRRPAHKPLVNWSLCFSIVFHKISLVRTSGDSFRTCVFDALEGARDGCLQGEPVLTSPAPPSRRTPPRLEPPVALPGFGPDKFSNIGRRLRR